MSASANFSELRKQMQAADEAREKAIQQSREIVRLSKQTIYALQRNDKETANRLMSTMKTATKALQKSTETGPQLKIAEQEYVEAACFASFINGKKLASAKSLGVQPENYLLGVCDLAGELVRFAVNAAIKGDKKAATNARTFLDDIYGELLQFDFRNGELRKKFDGVKYELKKLDTLVFELKK